MKKILAAFKNLYKTTAITQGIISKVKILSLYLTLSAKRWLGIKPEFETFKRTTVWVGGVSAPFYIKRQIDFDVLRDVFTDDQYDIDEPVDAHVIFDLGSNVGATVIRFCLKYPQAKVYAIEPDPKNIESLKKNTALFKDRVTIIDKAVADTNGKKVKFYTGSQYHWSSSLTDRPELYTDNYTLVETVTIDSMLQKYHIEHIDILKCDIEGGEEAAFKAFQAKNKVDYILGELHPTIINMSTDNFFQLFDGFQLFFIDKKTWVFKLKRVAT